MAKKKLYSFDDHPDHKAQLDAWRDKWVANALNCEPMTAGERVICTSAVDGLYEAANLPKPLRTIFVSSPLVGAVACSVASGAWWLRDNPDEAKKLFGRALSESEIMSSVAVAARDAIMMCLSSLRGDKVVHPTRAATAAATDAATRAATGAAIGFLIRCSVHWWKFWNGGNMWSGWCAYLTFFRHVSELDFDYSKFDCYEQMAIHAGPRFMHAKFCIVSDRPEFVHREQVPIGQVSRAHRIDGPQIRWRDGVELHHIHGIRVDPRITAGKFTAQEVRDQPNAEVRRVMLERYNQGDSGRYLRDIGATVIHSDVDCLGQPRRLMRIDQQDDEPIVVVEVTNSTPEPDGTRKIYTFRCHPELRPLQVPGIRDDLGPAQKMTCHNAIASTYGMTGDEYKLAIET